VSMVGLLAGLLVLASLSAARAAGWARRRGAVKSRLSSVAVTVERPGAVLARDRLGPTWAVLAPPPWLAGCLRQAGLAVSAARAWSWWLATTVAVVVAGLASGGPGAAVVAVGVCTAAPVVAWRMLRHRGQAALEAALPGAVEEVARGLRSGASLRQALEEAGRATPGPLGLELAQVASAAGHGASLTTALEWWAERCPLQAVSLVVAALGLGAETGGAQAQALGGVASTLRQRLAAQTEARALATQARAAAAVIAAAPLAFCALASSTDPRTSGFLLREPFGLACLVAGLGLDAAGALWMARLTRIAP
jgi:tight adherence protein B